MGFHEEEAGASVHVGTSWPWKITSGSGETGKFSGAHECEARTHFRKRMFQFQMYSKVIHIFYIIVYYKILNVFPCAI